MSANQEFNCPPRCQRCGVCHRGECRQPSSFAAPDWLGPFAGLSIVESVHLVVQHRHPRTKNRRIRKKWAKRKENFKPIPTPLVNAALGVVYVHPVVARRLRAALGPNGK
jgi:hypothetical protein